MQKLASVLYSDCAVCVIHIFPSPQDKVCSCPRFTSNWFLWQQKHTAQGFVPHVVSKCFKNSYSWKCLSFHFHAMTCRVRSLMWNNTKGLITEMMDSDNAAQEEKSMNLFFLLHKPKSTRGMSTKDEAQSHHEGQLVQQLIRMQLVATWFLKGPVKLEWCWNCLHITDSPGIRNDRNVWCQRWRRWISVPLVCFQNKVSYFVSWRWMETSVSNFTVKCWLVMQYIWQSMHEVLSLTYISRAFNFCNQKQRALNIYNRILYIRYRGRGVSLSLQ